ncbi:MAG: hypothetical protein IAE80_12340 [Anaerolinea sp.]|nr:hypothetical protein [Anaerolinea sp.]
MKQRARLVIIIPAGALSSKNRYEHMVDTIESIQHYAGADHKIVIQDNSAPMHLGDRLGRHFPSVDVVRAPVNYGLFGGLYKSLSLALLHVHATYDYDVLMKMDTDALMTGAGIADDAIRFFADNPNVGEIGNHLFAGKGIEYPRDRARYEASNLGWLRDRQRCSTMRLYMQQARANGWRDGEHILGGTAIYNPEFIKRLVNGDYLLREELRRTMLQEDHLWGMLCYAVGMKIARFHIPENPLAVVWKGLPRSPQALVEVGAKIVHSTRYWNGMNEDQIRAFFRHKRLAAPEVSQPQREEPDHAPVPA